MALFSLFCFVLLLVVFFGPSLGCRIERLGRRSAPILTIETKVMSAQPANTILSGLKLGSNLKFQEIRNIIELAGIPQLSFLFDPTYICKGPIYATKV